MPLPPFDLDTATPAEMEARRQLVFREIATTPGAEETCDVDLLKEAAILTQKLRAKNAGPPKAVKKPTVSKKKMSAEDLLSQL